MNITGGLRLREWMETYNLFQTEVAETFCVTQPAVHKMLRDEQSGDRTFYLLESDEEPGLWQLVSVKLEHVGKLPWL